MNNDESLYEHERMRWSASSVPSRDARIDHQVLTDRLNRHASAFGDVVGQVAPLQSLAESTEQVSLRDWNVSIAPRRPDDPRRDARRNEHDSIG